MAQLAVAETRTAGTTCAKIATLIYERNVAIAELEESTAYIQSLTAKRGKIDVLSGSGASKALESNATPDESIEKFIARLNRMTTKLETKQIEQNMSDDIVGDIASNSEKVTIGLEVVSAEPDGQAHSASLFSQSRDKLIQLLEGEQTSTFRSQVAVVTVLPAEARDQFAALPGLTDPETKFDGPAEKPVAELRAERMYGPDIEPCMIEPERRSSQLVVFIQDDTAERQEHFRWPVIALFTIAVVALIYPASELVALLVPSGAYSSP